jgi:signal transduction histidine kinase
MLQINQSYRPHGVPGSKSEVLPKDISICLINAQEEERSRVARELHDDLSQKMALLSMELERLRPMVTDAPALRKHFRNVQDRVTEISTDIHRLSHKLHPSKLDHLGLAAATKGLCRDYDSSGQIKVDFLQEGDFSGIPKDVTLCIFRIAQEALRNCVKHSGARSACVELERVGKELKLVVSDFGQGFEMTSSSIRNGLGFTSMRERVRIVGGTIAIRSEPGQGTNIEVSIPLGLPAYKVERTVTTKKLTLVGK